MAKATTVKPRPPKAKKTSPLKAKKTVSLKAKDTTTPLPKKSTATKFLALKKTEDVQFRKEALEKRKALKKPEGDDRRGVIVVSNIPHGFFEGQMNRYFRQFGKVDNVKLVRSKRTGQSCGFAYVEFQHYEVAKIVAKHMDGYLTFGKIMKCKVVPPEVVTDKLFKGKNVRPDNCLKLNMRKGAIRMLNKKRTEKQVERRVARLKSTYSKKIKKLQELGIDLFLQTLLGTEQQSDGAVEGQAKNGHITPDAAPSTVENNNQTSPSKYIKPDLTEEQKKELGVSREELAAKIMSHLESAKKTKKTKKSGAKTKSTTGEKMVLEVDESDDEVVLKTPPNAVKRYVKMGAESTPTATPKRKNKTPKSAKGTPKEGKATPKSAKGTPKAGKGILKAGKVTPKSAKGSPKSVEGTPKAANTPKKMKTPKMPQMTPGAKKATPKAKNKTPKAAETTSQVPEVIPEPDAPKTDITTPTVSPKPEKKTPKIKKMTPKTANATPKVKKSSALVTQATPKMEEWSVRENTPKTEKKTPKIKKGTPGIKNLSMENLQDTPTPVSKKKSPKAKKMGVVSENGVSLGGESTPKKKSAAASPKGKKLSPRAKKLTPKPKKMTPRASPKSDSKREATQPTSTPGKAVALTPQATPGKKKGKASQTPALTPKVTPGKRKQSADMTPMTEATPSKKEKLKKATPGKSLTSSPKTPKKSAMSSPKTPKKSVVSSPKTPKKPVTPNAVSGKKTDGKTPKKTPGKRKSGLEFTPDGKSLTKKQKVPMVS